MASRRLGSAALALLLAAVVMIGVYGPTLVYLTTPDLAPSPALDFLSGHHGALHDLAYRFAARVRLPLGFLMLPTNFLGVEWHNEHGHLSFLFGRTDLDGWWYFYPVALAVKTPLPLLLLGLSGLGCWRCAAGAKPTSIPWLRLPASCRSWCSAASTATSTLACGTC
jgi:hypothetical protein